MIASPSLDTIKLDIYIEPSCISCQRSLQMADWVRASFPWVRVRVMEPQQDRSEQAGLVRATPSYFLNGRQLFLGNPSEAELAEVLRDAASAG